jgi:hypothetical protein
MVIEWMRGVVWRRAGSARRSTTDDMGRGTAVGEASLLAVEDREEPKEEIYSARTRRRADSVETPQTFVMSIAVSCGSRDWKRWRTELDFSGSEPFDDHHGASTLRTAPKIFRIIGS